MPTEPSPERIEWIAGWLCAALVAGIIGFLLYDAVFTAETLPELSVALDPPISEPGGTHLRFTVENTGGQAASAVTVSLTFSDGAEVTERRVTLDYVPAHSRATGGLYLPAGAAAVAAEAAVEGYADP